ncbi:MAG: hypothetical protein L3J51_00035 [Cocleimonas sp.]|nr:hypothetical protein [Cocleimonas sp.]
MYKLTQKILASLLLIAMSATAIADDIDIISQSVPIKTNVLFVMDLSGSMNRDAAGNEPPLAPGVPSRLSELQGAFQDIVADPDFEDINIGLSVFSGAAQNRRGAGRAHGITYPVAPVTGKNPQLILDENHSESHPRFVEGDSYMPAVNNVTMMDSSMTPPEVNTRKYLSLLSAATTTEPSGDVIWSADGSTPIVDALYEAALYFKGHDVFWGRQTADNINAAHPSTYTGELSNVTVTPACVSNPNDAGYNRTACSRGSCGATQACGMVTQRKWSATDTGNNCTAEPNRCRAPTLGGTCGLGTNCSDSLSSRDRTCESSHTTIASCTAAHPTWQSCQIENTQSCTTDNEGVRTCVSAGTRIKCKEMRTYCDDVDDYQCDVQVEECTRCPGPRDQVAGIATYKTPIIEKCPANGIVLLSDGAPTANTSAGLIPPMIITPTVDYANGCSAGSDDGRCGPELASYLASEDQSDIDGDQPVRTFTVGLALPPGSPQSAYMEDLALAGNGDFVNANDRAGLALAFKQAILAIAKRERTFSAPTYTVNSSTQLTHGDSVYVPMFDRGTGVAWPGNLKKYKLQNGKLYGVKNGASVEATDADGLLKADVQDLWEGPQLGGPITSGGAAHKIPTPALRNIFTNAVGGSNVLSELKVSNSAVTAALLNAPTALDRHRYIKYIRGEKADGTPRHHMGDIIHSKPLQLSYPSGKSVLFVGTNEGYLHAIDADTGREIFAFMPSELLKNVKLQYENAPSTEHVYGVDGPMKLWLDDTNKNGVKDSGEDAYLYFGLRRGGGSYYALKLNNTMTGAPTLAWKVDSSSDPKLSDLGFTWSEPTLAKLRYDSSIDPSKPTPVLVFGGGYVDDHIGEAVNSGRGAAVYIIDALTGDHRWDSSEVEPISGSPAETVDYAVPAKVRTVDVDRNGSIDRLYFGDTGGNLWRVDLGGTGSNANRLNLSKSNLIHLAQLGDGSMANGANDRKFFTEPDVAFLKQKGKYALTIAIGSGSRPDVLNTTVDNHFFVIRDKDVFRRPTTTPAVITIADLEDAGSSINIVSANKKGWKMPLTDSSTGEKVLSSALTFQNKVLFTSLVINEVTVNNYSNNVCSLNNNTQARLYALDLLTGDAVLNLDGDPADTTDTHVTVTGGEILETPQIIYGDFVDANGGACTTSECARTYSIHAGKGPSKANSNTFTSKPIPVSKTLPRVYWLDKDQ